VSEVKHFILLFSTLLMVSDGALTSQEISPSPDPVVTPTIRLPVVPVLVEPDTPPEPVPASEAISTLKPDEWYVVESTRELIVLSSPAGVVDIESAAGPIKVRGLFADGTGKIETRGYRAAFVYFITASSPGKVELILIPAGVSTETDIVRQVLTVSGIGPNPPPVVDPVVPVDPIVPPTPTVGKLKLMILEDPSQRASLPASQVAVLTGQTLREYAKSHCTATDGAADFRMLSVRQDVSNQAAWIKAAFAEPRASLPFLVVSNGTSGFAGPLPATVAETMTLLQRYGGP